jgi:hypothetical protein
MISHHKLDVSSESPPWLFEEESASPTYTRARYCLATMNVGRNETTKQAGGSLLIPRRSLPVSFPDLLCMASSDHIFGENSGMSSIAMLPLAFRFIRVPGEPRVELSPVYIVPKEPESAEIGPIENGAQHHPCQLLYSYFLLLRLCSLLR